MLDFTDRLKSHQFATNFCISLRNRYLYAPIPKVAHTTMKLLLSQLEIKGLLVNISDLHVHEILYSPFVHPYQLSDDMVSSIVKSPDFFRFTFVRDPFDRLISAYIDKIERGSSERNAISKILGKSETDPITLVEFLLAIKSQAVPDMDMHWKPQTAIALWGKLQYDMIGRLENFSADMNTVFKRITGQPAAASVKLLDVRHHATNAAEVSDEYLKDKVAKELLLEIYADDFRAFSYSTR